MHRASNPFSPADGKLIGITELQDVRDIEGRQAALAARIVWVLQAVKTPQPDVVGAGQRGIVNRLGEGIGRQELQIMREAFLRADLEGMVDGVGDWRFIAGEPIKTAGAPS
jgi:hypothetical protein